MVNVAILYWSKTGNTEKVAVALKEGLEEAGADVVLRKMEESEDVDFFDYDLICVGAPSYQWRPPKPVESYLLKRFKEYRSKGRVKLKTPRVPGKHALVFCTYSGPHTGISEAIPTGKYMGQFFDHLGFNMMGEWYVVGEFHSSVENSTLGRLGDIRGRPNAADLEKVRKDAKGLFEKVRQAV